MVVASSRLEAPRSGLDRVVTSFTSSVKWWRRDSPSNWERSFERSLFVMFGLMVANNTLISSSLLRQTFQATGSWGKVGLVVGIGTLAGAAILLMSGLRPTWLTYTAAVAMMGAQILVAVDTDDSSKLPDIWWAWQLVIPVCVLIAGTLPLRELIPSLGCVIVIYAAIRLSPASGPSFGPLTVVSDVSFFALFAVVTAVAAPAWRRTAQVTDGAARARRRAHAETERARAIDRQRRAAARLLHDEVIHTLRGISLRPGAISPDVIREMAGDAGELLNGAGQVISERDLVDQLGDLAQRSSLAVTVRSSPVPTLPIPVVDALVGAVAEALRNVERHAGCDAARIDVAPRPGGVEVHVVDSGRGFETEAGAALLGCRHSIFGRIQDIGGHAAISSVRGRGTSVWMSWEPVAAQTPQPASSYRFADLAGTRHRLIVGIVPPFLVFTMLQAVLNQKRLSNSIPTLTAIGVMTAITVGAIMWARTRAISGWQSLLFITTAICTTLIGGWYLVAGSTVELAYFAAGAGGPLLSLVAFFRPPWESMMGALLATAAIVAMVNRMDADPAVLGRSLPAVMSNLIAVVAVLAARLTIHGMGRSVLYNEELGRQAESTRAQLAGGHRVMSDRLGRVKEWVLPFLRGVATGHLDPAEPLVRQQAAALEAAVRDDIRLGPAIEGKARQLVARARAGGRQVEINAEPDLISGLPSGLVSQLLTAALDVAVAPERTVLTVSSAADGGPVLSLFVAPRAGVALRALAARLGADIVGGAHFQLLRLPVTAPPLPTQAAMLVPVNSPGTDS